MDSEPQALNAFVDELLGNLKDANEMLNEMLGASEGITCDKCGESEGRLGILAFSLTLCKVRIDVVLAQLKRLGNQIG